MNFFLSSIILITIFASAFATDRGAHVISTNPSIFLSVFAIFAAAVLVRLNRGLPSVDWKSVDSDILANLLDKLEDVSRDYIIILIIIFVGIAFVLLGSLAGEDLVFVGVKVGNVLSGISGG